MPYPNEFYYTPPQSGRSYNSIGTGDIDFDELTNGRPCFIQPGVIRHPKKKALILADWTARSWSDEKTVAVQKTLAQSMDDGFTVYIWQAGTVRPLLRNELTTLSQQAVREALFPVFPKELCNTAISQYKLLTIDGIQLLDDYWLERALNTEIKDTPRTLSASAFSKLGEYERKKMIDILPSVKPPLTRLVHDEFSTKSNQAMRELHAAFPDISSLPTEPSFYKRVTLDNMEMIKELADDRPVILGNFRLIKRQIIGVEELSVISKYYEKIEAAQASCLLSSLTAIIRVAASSLKKLNLIASNVLTDDMALADVHLLALEEAALCYSSITAASLAALLKAAPNLKKLNLKGCKALTKVMALMPYNVPKLEDLDLSNSNITAASLAAILRTASSLKKLDLSACQELADDMALAEVNLLALEEVDLSYSNITAANLAALLKAAPNLKKLNLSSCQALTEGMGLTDVKFPKLELLGLSDSNITAANLAALLRAAPNLKIVDLTYCTVLIDAMALMEVNLQGLKEVSLHNSDITAAHLVTLLKAAPNLKILKLQGCPALTDAMALTPDSFPKLEVLVLSDSNITAANLAALLRAAPNLKTLNMQSCPALTDAMALRPDSFPTLEVLDLYDSNMTPANLATLLRAAPNLKIVYLQGFQALTEAMALTSDSLPKLEELVLYDSNITPANLAALLRAAPRLKKLNLAYCTALIDDVVLTEINLLVLEELDLSDTTITPATLAALRKAAPNLNIKYNMSDNPDSSHTSALVAPKDPQHNAAANLTSDPHRKLPFKYQGLTTKDQFMMIERLSQYLTVTKQHPITNAALHVEEMQIGICNALSHYFLEIADPAWGALVDEIHGWNGQVETLTTQLITTFDQLYRRVETHQFEGAASLKQCVGEQYVGDALAHALNLLQDGEGYIVSRPRHTIAVRKKSNSEWQVYDPNFVEGYKTIETCALAVDAVHQTIGSILSIESDKPMPLAIGNQAQFIRDGGLLALVRCANHDAISEKLDGTLRLSKEALTGILHRDTSGTPAWILGIHHANPAVAAFTARLLVQFKVLNGDADAQLHESLSALTGPQQLGLVETPLTSTSSDPLHETIQAILRTATHSIEYEKTRDALKTWIKSVSGASTAIEYCKRVVAGDVEKRLIEFHAEEDVNRMQLALQRYSQDTRRPIFHINTPDDLICSAAYIEYESDGKGRLQKGPGGRLYDFLTRHGAEARPILVVNYSQFKADDIVRFNALLDSNPSADGTLLPVDITIIGLVNVKKLGCSLGEDFYSRFDKVDEMPVSKAELAVYVPPLDVHKKTDEPMQTHLINLYGAPDWESRLLGRWVLEGDSLTYQAGALKAAIDSGLPIELRNAPWGDEKFTCFLNQARLSANIHSSDGVIALPDGTKFIQSEGYALTLGEGSSVLAGLLLEPASQVLNPARLGAFFNQYECDNETHLLQKKAGLIKSAAGGSLDINLTRNLDESAWAMVLDECANCNVKLHIHCSPGVSLPDALKPVGFTAPPMLEPVLCLAAAYGAHTNVIASTDLDATVALITRAPDADWTVIDVSECNASDLLGRMRGALNTERLTFEFNQSESMLLKALQAGKSILLKGRFTADLVDALAPLLLGRQGVEAPQGKLVLVVDRSIPIPYVQNRLHEVSQGEKAHLLRLTAPLQTDAPFAVLRTRQTFLRAYPGRATEEAWIGLHDIPGGVPRVEPLDTATSEQASTGFTQARADQVNAVLAFAPFVFISGLSGVGKSTFVEQELCQGHDELFPGEQEIRKWAQATGKGRKLLFIDEANLSTRDWSEFEGLFNTPPGVLIDGVYHLLTPEHKVVFAGNPASYGGERHLATLFQRHGNATLFTPLPTAVLYEKILKPVFQGVLSDTEAQAHAKAILAAYTFLCSCSTTEVLISPRELQMMALLIADHCKRNPEQSTALIRQHIIYNVAQTLVPAAHRAAFNQQFAPIAPLSTFTAPETTDSNAFLITPSRHHLTQQLGSLLGLRESRRGHGQNDEQRYGGLGGIILEGEPGIGKSELVIAVLRALGYEEIHYDGADVRPAKANAFYRMPVSMPLAEKEALLRKAFHEGAVVFIDEINSSPMMEHLLNSLLMGKTEDNKRPEKPGFMIIGTQNPVTMSGRLAPSTALSRRLMTMILPAYPTNEMEQILIKTGLPQEKAADMVKAYEENRAHAKIHHLSPAPTFRDLLRLAEQAVEGAASLQRLDKEKEPQFIGANFPNEPRTREEEVAQGSFKDRFNRCKIAPMVPTEPGESDDLSDDGRPKPLP